MTVRPCGGIMMALNTAEENMLDQRWIGITGAVEDGWIVPPRSVSLVVLVPPRP